MKAKSILFSTTLIMMALAAACSPTKDGTIATSVTATIGALPSDTTEVPDSQQTDTPEPAPGEIITPIPTVDPDVASLRTLPAVIEISERAKITIGPLIKRRSACKERGDLLLVVAPPIFENLNVTSDESVPLNLEIVGDNGIIVDQDTDLL